LYLKERPRVLKVYRGIGVFISPGKQKKSKKEKERKLQREEKQEENQGKKMPRHSFV